MMSEEDKEDYMEARMYVEGVVALLLSFKFTSSNFHELFEYANEFLKEFEKRNGIK